MYNSRRGNFGQLVKRMLTGNLVRVKFAKNKIAPQYLPTSQGGWLGLAEQLLLGFRAAAGRTRGEIYGDLAEVIGEGQPALVPRGLADLLEDRCEFEVNSDFPPDTIREAVFREAAKQRIAGGQTFDRTAVLAAASKELALSTELIEQGLFADLKDEKRVLKFEDCTAEFLLERYNVALAQAVLLLRCTAMEARIWGETPARFRQLFRMVKFHRLIASIHESTNNSYVLKLDGPLSLFSATNKYGLQLALFLPSLLHCKAFDLQASIRWGVERKEKQFALVVGGRPAFPFEGFRSLHAAGGAAVRRQLRGQDQRLADRLRPEPGVAYRRHLGAGLQIDASRQRQGSVRRDHRLLAQARHRSAL